MIIDHATSDLSSQRMEKLFPPSRFINPLHAEEHWTTSYCRLAKLFEGLVEILAQLLGILRTRPPLLMTTRMMSSTLDLTRDVDLPNIFILPNAKVVRSMRIAWSARAKALPRDPRRLSRILLRPSPSMSDGHERIQPRAAEHLLLSQNNVLVRIHKVLLEDVVRRSVSSASRKHSPRGPSTMTLMMM